MIKLDDKLFYVVCILSPKNFKQFTFPMAKKVIHLVIDDQYKKESLENVMSKVIFLTNFNK